MVQVATCTCSRCCTPCCTNAVTTSTTSWAIATLRLLLLLVVLLQTASNTHCNIVHIVTTFRPGVGMGLKVVHVSGT